MDLTNVDDLKVAMQLAGLKASKGLGQHFLVDRASLEAVMRAGELETEDVVLEIGPGLGVMTFPLVRKVSRVIAIEVDRFLAAMLQKDRPANLEVRQEDVLELDIDTLPVGYKVIANIPYYLTSKIFRMFLESSNSPKIMSVLIQKEVAQRIAAKPGQMSVLAFSVQYFGEPRVICLVEKHKFWPSPKVDSAVLQVKVYENPAFPADQKRLFRLIKAGFGEKRKMLKNSLAGGLNVSMQLVETVISDSAISPTARAQELSLVDWHRLYDICVERDII